jgi:hypothetical protein
VQAPKARWLLAPYAVLVGAVAICLRSPMQPFVGARQGGRAQARACAARVALGHVRARSCGAVGVPRPLHAGSGAEPICACVETDGTFPRHAQRLSSVLTRPTYAGLSHCVCRVFGHHGPYSVWRLRGGPALWAPPPNGMMMRCVTRRLAFGDTSCVLRDVNLQSNG